MPLHQRCKLRFLKQGLPYANLTAEQDIDVLCTVRRAVRLLGRIGFLWGYISATYNRSGGVDGISGDAKAFDPVALKPRVHKTCACWIMSCQGWYKCSLFIYEGKVGVRKGVSCL